MPIGKAFAVQRHNGHSWYAHGSYETLERARHHLERNIALEPRSRWRIRHCQTIEEYEPTSKKRVPSELSAKQGNGGPS